MELNKVVKKIPVAKPIKTMTPKSMRLPITISKEQPF